MKMASFARKKCRSTYSFGTAMPLRRTQALGIGYAFGRPTAEEVGQSGAEIDRQSSTAVQEYTLNRLRRIPIWEGKPVQFEGALVRFQMA
jgi:hypothetical protein